MNTQTAKNELAVILDDSPDLQALYDRAEDKGLPVDYDDGFDRHGIPEDGTAIVLDCEDGDLLATAGPHGRGSDWQIEVAPACEECDAVDTEEVDVDRVDDPGYGHPSGKVWLCEHCQ